MAEQDLDRSQAATPYKLQKARERGQVPRSHDLASAVVFAAAMVFLAWQGWSAWSAQLRLDQALLAQAGRVGASPAALWPLVDRMLRSSLALGAPFLATLVVAAILGNVLQGGWVLSLEPIKPDWTRLDPVAGLKRLLSLRTLFHALRAVLKLLLLGATAYFALRGLAPHFRALAGHSAMGALRTLLDDFASLGLKLALALGLVALLDLLYTRREFARQMRMSPRELKEEVKHREGDPRIRARLRELRRELLKKALAVQRTRRADVVITNPAHVAVALRYAHGEMASPQLVAKGAGALAGVMRRIAARHGIPIVQNPPLARQLYRALPVDGSVPPELYAPVARIVVWVLAQREARGPNASQGRSPWPS